MTLDAQVGTQQVDAEDSPATPAAPQFGAIELGETTSVWPREAS